MLEPHERVRNVRMIKVLIICVAVLVSLTPAVLAQKPASSVEKAAVLKSSRTTAPGSVSAPNSRFDEVESQPSLSLDAPKLMVASASSASDSMSSLDSEPEENSLTTIYRVGVNAVRPGEIYDGVQAVPIALSIGNLHRVIA